MDYEAKLKEMGVILPQAPPPAGAYVPAVRTGNLVFCSGQGTYKEGKLHYIGRVGQDVTLEEAYEGARLAAINCLAEIVTVAGSLNNIEKVIHVRGFINSATDFHDQPLVLNGASEFLLELFGEKGKHARAALGTSNLPGNICVEVEMIVELKE
jgi:enamine deaminase RidA (YjgF/YER057c/UK114 family)